MHEGAEIEVDFGSIEYRRVAGNQAFISQCANPGPAGCGLYSYSDFRSKSPVIIPHIDAPFAT